MGNRSAGLWVIAGFLCSSPLPAQSTATIAGLVTDPSGAVIYDARVSLQNALTGFRQTMQSDLSGAFRFANVPFRNYTLTVEKPGFAGHMQSVELRSNVPVEVKVELALVTLATQTVVRGTAAEELLDTQQTGTRTELSAASMEKLPLSATSRGLESVLLTFPGFAQNANGAIHPRGAHNQMSFVVDGMPITDQLTGAFATSLDTNIVQSLQLFTGDTPAEYGQRTAAVANVTTRTGMDSGRWFQGTAATSLAQFDTVNSMAQFLGGNEKWGYFSSISGMKSNRFLDAVSLDNLHNGGNAERVFTRLDYRPSAHDTLRLNMMAGRSSFQLANLRSQHANGQDQRQRFQDYSLLAGWVRTLNAQTTLDATASYRTSQAWLYGSAGDTPVTADQARRLSTLSLAVRGNAVRGAHTLRGGVDYQYFPVREHFSFAITDGAFNAPGNEDFNPGLAPHDLTRGGRRLEFRDKQAGHMPSVFVQDMVRWRRFTFSLGLRHDLYRFLVTGQQLQPRIGVAFHLRETGTVLRASYNRTYQTPPNENLLLSSSETAARLAPPAVREALGSAVVRIRPERQNFWEAGLQQQLGRLASLNVAVYYKNSRDQQDNDNFLNTGIIFPITLQAIRVNGAEARLNLPQWRGFSGALSATHYRAISTPPFTGGLFLGSGAVDALSAGPFVIDHDQRLGMQGNWSYTGRRGWWVSQALRYDSGLVSNRSDAADVAADPDYFDLLPYVNLASDPPRVRPRTVVDVAAGYTHRRGEKRLWEIGAQCTNLTNRTALYNFQSIFVGTRVVQPRTLGLRLRVFF